MLRATLVAGLVTACLAMPARAQWDVSGSLELEFRVFPEAPAFAGQDYATVSPSAAFQPEIVYEWADGDKRLTFEPFVRGDVYDEQRTHFDIREWSHLHLADTWDATVGISRVFWGVTESVHLVDIINQTDSVEDVDTEDKLGQPMVNVNLLRDSGTYSFFVLPGFRKRTFPADDARRRGPFRIDARQATFDAGAEEAHVDFAFRWYRTIGDWDVALSHFNGTGREPRFNPFMNSDGSISLRPHYDLIDQTGVEIQYTKNAWLWKFEGMSRWGQGRQFFAGAGGFEYTLYQILDSAADLGLLLEYQFDDRSDAAPRVASDNDVFAGARLALNDESSTAILAGLVVDTKNGTTNGFVEADRRLSENWKVALESRLFLHAHPNDVVYGVRRDDSINLKATYSF